MSLLSRLFNFLTGKKSPETIIYDLMASTKTMEGDFLCLRYLIRHCEENSGDHASFRALDSFLKHTWKSKLSPEDLFCAGVRLAEEAASLSFNGDVYSMVLRHSTDYIEGGQSSLTSAIPRTRATQQMIYFLNKSGQVPAIWGKLILIACEVFDGQELPSEIRDIQQSNFSPAAPASV